MRIEVRRIGSGCSFWKRDNIGDKRTVLHFAPGVQVDWIGIESDLITITTDRTYQVKDEGGSFGVDFPEGRHHDTI